MASHDVQCELGEGILREKELDFVSSIKHMFLRNRSNSHRFLDRKSEHPVDAKRLKTVKVVRVNGISKITIDSPARASLQSESGLRSRTNKRSVPTEIPRKRRRSPRLDKHEDSDSTESEDCVNNNKTTTSLFIPPKELPTPPSDTGDSLSSCSSSAAAFFSTVSRNGEVPCGIPGTALLSAPLSPPETSRSSTPPSGASTPAICSDRSVHPLAGQLPAVAALKRQDSSKSCDSSTTVTTCLCKWLKCGITVPQGDLLDHIKEVHVDPQKDINYSPPNVKIKSQGNAHGSSINGSTRSSRNNVNNACRTRNSVHGTSKGDDSQGGNKEEKQKKYMCLWEGCKVYSKPSCSFSWIERHFLLHCGDRPFRCIVDECGQRFTSQVSLERHVNSHFNTYQPQQNQRPPKPVESITPSKSTKRRKVKRTRRTCIIKTTDYFDAHIMEKLQYQLISFSQKTQMDLAQSESSFLDETDQSSQAMDLTNQSEVLPSATSVTFRSSVIAKRKEPSGKVKVLLRWYPNDILPDSWVLESQAATMETKVVPLACLPRDTASDLHPSLYAQHRHRKQRRK